MESDESAGGELFDRAAGQIVERFMELKGLKWPEVFGGLVPSSIFLGGGSMRDRYEVAWRVASQLEGSCVYYTGERQDYALVDPLGVNMEEGLENLSFC